MGGDFNEVLRANEKLGEGILSIMLELANSGIVLTTVTWWT